MTSEYDLTYMSIGLGRQSKAIRECSRRPVWTLVFTGPKRRTWGFWVYGGTRFVPWRDYEKLYGA